MIEKIEKNIVKALAKVNTLHIARTPQIMIYLFLVIIFLCIVLFILAWSADWVKTGRGNLQAMTVFVQSLTSVSFIAAVGFFGKALIDDDDDGIPDEFEKGSDEKKKVSVNEKN